MIRVEGMCVVEMVTPKKGKGDKLMIKLETQFSDDKLLGFAEIMMSGKEAKFDLEYDDTPLFPEEESDQPDLPMSEDEALEAEDAEAEE